LSIEDSVIINQLPTRVHSKALRLYDVTNTGLVVGNNLHDYRGIITRCCPVLSAHRGRSASGMKRRLPPERRGHPQECRRACCWCYRPVLVELVTSALNHRMCTVRTVTAVEEVETAVAEWQPRVLLVDMALNGLHILQTVRTRADMG
jgi:hypothetical protein